MDARHYIFLGCKHIPEKLFLFISKLFQLFGTYVPEYFRYPFFIGASVYLVFQEGIGYIHIKFITKNLNSLFVSGIAVDDNTVHVEDDAGLIRHLNILSVSMGGTI